MVVLVFVNEDWLETMLLGSRIYNVVAIFYEIYMEVGTDG